MRHEGVGRGCQPRRWMRGVVGGVVLLSILPLSTAVDARRSAPRTEEAGEPEGGNQIVKTGTSGPYRAVFVMEAETGKVLFEQNAHTPYPPASMVKMMTTLIVLEHVRDGSIKLSDAVTVSRWAADMGGSQVYLKEGETATVEDLLKAVMIHSANDAAVALSEHVAGSTDSFVDLMNDRAVQLGLKESRYHSVHGLPPEPGQEDDMMSAYDLAMLGRELMKFPEAEKWAATPPRAVSRWPVHVSQPKPFAADVSRRGRH